MRLAVALATVGGVGRAPVASGTVGTLVALPLVPAVAALHGRSPVASLAVVVAVTIIGIWAAGRAEEDLGGHDHSHIVIDEVVGILVAALFLPPTWLAVVLVFFLFRLFDVVKPFPASFFDGRIEGGLGVVGDDVVAGVYAGIATRLLLAVL